MQKLFGLAGVVQALLMILALGLQVKAQEKGDVIKIDTDLVTVEVTAVDRQGGYVRNLKPNDFKMYVDGIEKKIDFFSVTDDVTVSRPLSLVFALDLSGSLKPEEILTLKNSALKFTELMKGESMFAAMGFNYEVKIYQDFTSDPKKIERAFAKMDHFEGSTKIYDALDRAVAMLSKRWKGSTKPLRRVIIVITDGFDSSSLIEGRELIRRANAAGVTVYSVTLPSYILSASRNTDRVITPLDATRIVASTGGKDFSADARDFAPIFKALAEEIKSSYGIAYYPEVRDGKQHEIRIEAVDASHKLRTNRSTFIAPVH